MSKKNLHNVEIISINTHNPEASVKAIEYSSREFDFAAKKIFSHRMPYNIVTDDIQHIKINEFKLRESYSYFVLNELINYVHSEFIMMIHDDGFIINPHLWDDAFLEYDYIGAPWPGPKDDSVGRVGNGGFCIRSRKLIEVCKNLPNYNGENDDWFVGVTNRDLLVQQGFKFAPVSLAMKFALELPIEECEYSLDNCFGFHGKRSQQHYEKINLIA